MLYLSSGSPTVTPMPRKRRQVERPQFSQRVLVPLIGFGILILLSGCGESNPLGRKAISGKVTLNGKPLESGTVTFEPLADGGVGSGSAITDGTFSIPEEKGLPPGEYRVRLFAAGERAAPSPEPVPGAIAPPAPELIPPGWNAQSQHTITVKADGDNQFTFPVKTSAG